MKHIKIFEDFVREAQHEYDFVGIQAEKHGMSREEYTAYYLSEAKAISSQNKPFTVKGIRFTYTEQRGRFYGAYLYDVPQTANIQQQKTTKQHPTTNTGKQTANNGKQQQQQQQKGTYNNNKNKKQKNDNTT